MLLVLAACAPRTGWERTEQRSCAPAGPPRLCLLASPDAQLVATAGGATLVPGECVVAPRARGGRIAVTVRDGRAGASAARRIAVRRGHTTRISGLGGQIRVVERLGCESE